MSKIFIELIDVNYPIISHKYFNIKECCEHLVSEKNIVGYVIKGRKRIDNGEYINAGELFYMSIDNYTVTYQGAEEDHLYEEVAVCFTVDNLRSLLTNILTYDEIKDFILSRKNSFVETVFSEPISTSVKHVFDGLIHYGNEGYGKPLKDMLDKIKVTELLFTILIDENLHIGEAIVKMVKCNHDKLRVTISECVGKRYTVEQIASKCSMSTSQFKKVFNQIYGSSPHKWMATQQLEKAAFMLKTTDKPIGEIAEECEFSNPSHLIKRFKEAYDITPSGYRKKSME